jgi:hypothetical protein
LDRAFPQIRKTPSRTTRYGVEGFLLVDDTDGRVLAEFFHAAEALRAFDELEQQAPDLADSLSLVRFDEHQGSLVATQTSIRLQSLT